jgi:hypothetical protein
MPEVRACRRALPFCDPLFGRIALPWPQEEYLSHCRNSYAVEPHASLDLVLGCLPHDDADTRSGRIRRDEKVIISS